jgi:hypothetical protein
MRSLRRILAGVALACLLVGFPGLTLASAPPATVKQPPSEFEGLIGCPFYWRDGHVTNVVLGTIDGGNLVRRETRGAFWRETVEGMSDTRFDGTIWTYFDTDEYVYYPDADIEDHPAFITGLMRVENPGGAWQGSFQGTYWPAGPFAEPMWFPVLLTGEGAYEGLTAILGMLFSEDPCGWQVRGFVFEGQMPKLPEVTQ